LVDFDVRWKWVDFSREKLKTAASGFFTAGGQANEFPQFKGGLIYLPMFQNGVF